MGKRRSAKRAVARWHDREFVKEFLKLLKSALEAAKEHPSLLAIEPSWRRDALAAGFSEQNVDDSWAWLQTHVTRSSDQQEIRESIPENIRRVLIYNALYIVDYAPDLLEKLGLRYVPSNSDALEGDWRRDASAAGLSGEKIEESWNWFRRDAFEAAPVLEEVEQRDARLTMPDSVRHVLAYNPLYWFVGYDKDLLAASEESPPSNSEIDPDEQAFWNDIGYALTDPPNRDTRQALDRLARLVHVKSEYVRAQADQDGISMAAAKRRLIQQAVLLSLDPANDRIRVGRRTTISDTGHPITLENVYTREGLQEIVMDQAESTRQSTSEIREGLVSSLGGPFRPVHLTDRTVYRSWLTKEIQRQTERLLSENLDIREVGRAGGARRVEVSYDETEPLVDDAPDQLGADTRAHTVREMRESGERLDRERAHSRTTDFRTRFLHASDRKQRIEEALVNRIDFQRLLGRIRNDREAPVLGEYIDRVLQEPELMDDDVAAAQVLGWSKAKVYDVKHRLTTHLALIAAEERWNSQSSNAL